VIVQKQHSTMTTVRARGLYQNLVKLSQQQQRGNLDNGPRSHWIRTRPLLCEPADAPLSISDFTQWKVNAAVHLHHIEALVAYYGRTQARHQHVTNWNQQKSLYSRAAHSILQVPGTDRRYECVVWGSFYNALLIEGTATHAIV
jgi:hypothetical protein